MIYDFSRANVRDMTDPTRTMWTCALDWADVLGLLSDPVAFFTSQKIPDMRFGDSPENIVFQLTDSPACGDGEIVVEGMDDTHIISMRVKKWAQGAPAPSPISLSHNMPVVIQLRQPDNLAVAHFHFDDEVERDGEAKARQIYQMIRYPQGLVDALMIQVAQANYLTVIGGVERSPADHRVHFTGPQVTAVVVETNRETQLAKACSRSQFRVVDDAGVSCLTKSGMMFQNYPKVVGAIGG